MTEKEVMNANKRALHDFYQVLKGTDDHLQFIRYGVEGAATMPSRHRQ